MGAAPIRTAGVARFTFQRRYAKLNWRTISRTSLERIVERIDTHSLEQMLEPLAFARLRLGDVSSVPEEWLLKLLRLYQLCLEYLMNCKAHLLQQLSYAAAEASEKGDAAVSLRTRCARLRAELKAAQVRPSPASPHPAAHVLTRRPHPSPPQRDSAQRSKALDAYSKMLRVHGSVRLTLPAPRTRRGPARRPATDPARPAPAATRTPSGPRLPNSSPLQHTQTPLLPARPAGPAEPTGSPSLWSSIPGRASEGAETGRRRTMTCWRGRKWPRRRWQRCRRSCPKAAQPRRVRAACSATFIPFPRCSSVGCRPCPHAGHAWVQRSRSSPGSTPCRRCGTRRGSTGRRRGSSWRRS